MIKKLVDLYKIPLLVSVTLSVVLIALRLERDTISLMFLVVGAVLGTFFLDLDYFIYAFLLEPNTDFSRTLASFVKNGDISNALSYIYYHKNDIAEKTLHSVFFQLVLAGAALLVVSSNSSYFIKAFVLSAFVNSIYRLVEHYLNGRVAAWFWMLKNKPRENSLRLYVCAFVLVFLYCLKGF